MAFAGRRGAVGEHVTEMAGAASADFLNTAHSIARISNTPDMRFVKGLKETRPTRPGIELRARSKERQTAKATGVNALFVIIEKNATEGRFRAVREQHTSLVFIKTGRDLRTLRLSWRSQIKSAHRGFPAVETKHACYASLNARGRCRAGVSTVASWYGSPAVNELAGTKGGQGVGPSSERESVSTLQI